MINIAERLSNYSEGMDRNSFLQDFINALTSTNSLAEKLYNVTVVFPNRRAGLFFKDKLAKSIRQPQLMPQVLTLEDMASGMSKLVLADKLTLIYQLYEVFYQHDRTIESFDRFYFWGEMLLTDFSEVDMGMVNAHDLFSNLKDLKVIDAGYDYLSEDQKKIIARFWESFRYDAEQNAVSSSQEHFLIFWNKLYPVYQQFRKQLLSQGLAYEGLLYRHIAESLTNDTIQALTDHFVFVGMNALKNAELEIISRLIHGDKATAYWDTDAHYLKDEVQEAGMFLRRYLRSKTLGPSFSNQIPDHFHSGDQRHIHIHGVPLEVGQAKKAGEYLLELSQKEGFDPERCVIILPEEHMLFPVLHTLPPAIRKVNVTMGYPLRNTSLYSFIAHILDLQLEKKKEERQSYTYHFASLLALLRHPYIKNYLPAEADQNIQNIIKSNAVYVSPADLKGDWSFYQKMLLPIEDVPSLFDYLQQLSMLLHRILHTKAEKDNASLPEVPMLEKELLYHFYIHLNRLKSLTQERHFDFKLPTFIKLLRQVFQSLRVPFTGEPLRGLQIMGLLETRNLDFDHVFVLSMNEGILPGSESQNSFIPANLRKGFGLFGVDQQDAFYAHAFFRLLHHAKEVHLFYNTEDTATLNGEMSRFLYQLYYESERTQNGELRFPDAQGDFVVTRDFLSMHIAPASALKISIAKTEEVWKNLQVYCKGNSYPRQAMLTPSALNTYLDCRLRFYYQFVVCMREIEEVEDELDAKVFGNILHKTMEVLYKEFVQLKGRRTIEAQDCMHLKGVKLDEAIHKGFKEHYQQEKGDLFRFEGRNIIAREIVRKMAKKILDHDSHYAPFEIVSLEERGKQGYHTDLEIEANGEKMCIALKGIIDRVDRKENVVRVLDYKTGRDERQIADIASLFDREAPRRNKAALQALFYAWLYQQSQNKQEESVIPGLVNATELFKDEFDPRLEMGDKVIADFANYREEFVSALQKLLEEIFNKNIPFDQTTDEKKCNYCPYANICY